MRDWQAFVRSQLHLNAVHPAREARLISEVAAQLEDLYQDAILCGASEEEADALARQHIVDWSRLAADLADVEPEARVPAAERRRELAVERLGDAPAEWPPGGVVHRLMGSIGLDARIGLRRLRASPASTAIAVAVLTLAIGASTAVFSVVDAVVLRGLPFDEHDRLVAVLETDPHRATSTARVDESGATTSQTYLDWRRLQTPFDGLAGMGTRTLRLRNEMGEPANARALRVSFEFFKVLRVAPLVGRSFRPGDEIIGQHQVAILSYGFWQRQFGGARDVVGRTTQFDGRPWEIVGVMPRGFTYPLGGGRETEVYVPLAFTDAERARAASGGMTRMIGYEVIGRLRSGVSLARAADQMNAVSAAMDAEHPTWRVGARVHLTPLHEHLVGKVRSWMLLLIGAVALVLAIACANVANLRLAQAVAASRRLAICIALGASRWRTTRAFLVENLLLSGSSAVLGVAFAWGGIEVLRAYLPPELPRVAAVSLDLRVLGVAVAASLVTGLLVGLAPSVLHLRGRLSPAISNGGSRATGGASARRFGNALVVAEVALAAVLLTGAGLFVASFTRLMRIDTGFDYRRVLSLNISTPVNFADADGSLDRGRTTIAQVREAVRAVPGVLGAEAVDGGAPLTGLRARTALTLPGRGELRRDEDLADGRVVTPGYLALLRIPLLRGRYLSDDDRADKPGVVVVNEAAAQKYWPGQDALHQRLIVRKVECEVVGIVGNIRHEGPEVPPRLELYLPLAQSRFVGLTLAVRTAGDAMATLRAVKRAIWSVSPDQRFNEIVTLEAFMDRMTARRRFNMTLLALFGGLGLAIAAAGVYAVLAHRVAQRTREIGVRMALGATPGNIVGTVLGQALVLVGIGLAIGLAAAWGFGTGVKAFLFGTKPTDPVVFAAALVALAAAGIAAAVAPGRRASRVDPIVTLRSE
jgi:predicted permease